MEAGYIEPDTSLSAEENVELLLRTTRLLQLGLEVQYAETQNVLAENNTLRGDLRVRILHWCDAPVQQLHHSLTGGFAASRSLRTKTEHWMLRLGSSGSAEIRKAFQEM